jgi:hypothetical protein
VPHYEQKELWDLLAAEMQIRTLAGFDAEAARKHGDRRIT